MKSVNKSNHIATAVAVFLAGIAVATFGWWQADRLDLAYGANAGINQVIEGAGSGGLNIPARDGGSTWTVQSGCDPRREKAIRKTYKGCQVITSTESCTAKQEYIKVEKKKSGQNLVVYERPTGNAMARTTYVPAVVEQVRDLKEEVESNTQDLDMLKKDKTVATLARDDAYQAKMKEKLELQKVIKENPKCLPPTPIRQTKTVPTNSMTGAY